MLMLLVQYTVHNEAIYVKALLNINSALSFLLHINCIMHFSLNNKQLNVQITYFIAP